jgi:4-diphosphocytidyl-2C-methyl-D-erythritol kinase
VLLHGAVKQSTKAVYDAFDRRGANVGFEARRAEVLSLATRLRTVSDLAELPRNDLVRSPLAGELEQLGALRADVTGAGPAVYGLFESLVEARRAARRLEGRGRVWVTAPAWYV